uniref:GDP-mannose 4,6 dehydratase 2 n=1 Tax=Arundo donax TaxID=35708 RepID=A0A0A9GWF0_ARUDO
MSYKATNQIQAPTAETTVRFLWLLLGITVPSVHKHLLLLGKLNVMINYLNDLLEPDLGLPLELPPRLGRVPLEAVDFCRLEVLLVADHMVLPAQPGVPECNLKELHGSR